MRSAPDPAHCADTVDRVEGTVNQAGAAFDIPVAEEAPQDLHHHARKAAGDADQSDLVKVDAGGKAIRLLLLQVDNGVGGGTAEEALRWELSCPSRRRVVSSSALSEAH